MPKQLSKANMKKALAKFDTTFDKSYGEDILDRSGIIVPYEVVSTGSLAIDYSMGVGGYVEGRLYEIWGPDGIGKTTLAFQAIREAQAKYPDNPAVWVDVEHRLDKAWMQIHGVDISPERLRIITPESAEQVADQVKDALRAEIFSIVVVDSIGAMIPEAEKEKDADQAVMAQQAKIVTRMVKIAAVEADKAGTLVILLNQVRANLSYGADTTTSGGFALKHCTTGKLKLSNGGREPFKVKLPGEDKPVRVGHAVAVMNERNSVAPAYRRAEFVLFTTATEQYGPVGIDRVDDTASMALKKGVIEQNGGWYTFPGGHKVNGRDAVVAHLRTEPDLMKVLRQQVLDTLSAEDIVPVDASNPLADPETGEIMAEDGIDLATALAGSMDEMRKELAK